jgi:hypothetical protein
MGKDGGLEGVAIAKTDSHEAALAEGRPKFSVTFQT